MRVTRLCIATGIFGVLFGIDGDAQLRVRHVVHDFLNEHPIADVLRADDEMVVLDEAGTGIELGHSPTAAELVTMSSLSSEFVMILEVVESQSHLVENGAWIRTSVRGRVIDVLRTRGVTASPGKMFAAEIEGGELKIGKVLVRSEIAGPLKSGRRYLLMLQDTGTGAFYYMYWPLLVTGNKVSTVDYGASPDSVTGLTVEKIKSLVRNAK
jgi:hypothetical protein